MEHRTLQGLERDERRVGSPFDPVLCGVAQGLATLFPPIEPVRSGAGEDGFETGLPEPCRAETASTESRTEPCQRP